MTEQDASDHKSIVIFQDLTMLPTLLAVVVTLGICKWLGLPPVWALGITAAVFVAVPTALIVVHGRHERRN